MGMENRPYPLQAFKEIKRHNNKKKKMKIKHLSRTKGQKSKAFGGIMKAGKKRKLSYLKA